MASISPTPSGKWRAVVRQSAGKHRSATFPRKRDAERWGKVHESDLTRNGGTQIIDVVLRLEAEIETSEKLAEELGVDMDGRIDVEADDLLTLIRWAKGGL